MTTTIDSEPAVGSATDEPAAPVHATPTNEVRRQLAELLEPLWRAPVAALIVSAAFGAAWGGLAGWWTPRGPLTTFEAVSSIIT